MSESREELRKKLRNKIRGMRDNSRNELQTNMKRDPQTTMMSLGVDDPNILNNAKSIVKNPNQFIQGLTNSLQEMNVEKSEVEKRKVEKSEETDSDEEGLPPEG